MSEKRSVDWEAVERDYRAGVLSVREIGRVHNVPEKNIRRRAKEREWHRDLADRVRIAAEEELARHDGDTAALQPQAERARAREDAEIVATAAKHLSNVVLSHRNDLARLHTRKRDIIDRLDRQRELDEQVAAGTREPPEGYEPLSLVQESMILDTLARIEGRLIPLERQAHSLDKGNPDQPQAEGERRRPNVFVAPAKIPTAPETRPLRPDDIGGDA